MTAGLQSAAPIRSPVLTVGQAAVSVEAATEDGAALTVVPWRGFVKHGSLRELLRSGPLLQDLAHVGRYSKTSARRAQRRKLLQHPHTVSRLAQDMGDR